MKRIISILLVTSVIISSLGVLTIGAGAIEIGGGGFRISTDGDVRNIGDNVYQISDYGISYSYLIVGSESCLLIDSGVGFENFRSRVEQYSQGKPITVALTHGHVDHIGGAFQFDTVYLNEADNNIKWQGHVIYRKLFAASFMSILKLISDVPAISDKNNVETTNFYNMEDGHVFDLGDRTVTFTLTPGHTSGSGCFFDSKTQYLFTGDMVSGCVLLIFAESDTVTKYRSSLDIIKKLQAKATKIYIGHSLDPVDPSTIDTLIQASDEIIKDSNVKLPLPFVKIKRSEQTVLILGWLCKVK